MTEGGLMGRSWVDGSEERMWKPSLRICGRGTERHLPKADESIVRPMDEHH